MKQILLLRITGIIAFLFAVLHMFFPLMPEWNLGLEAISGEMHHIFLTYHYILIVFLAGMGYISTFQTKQLLQSSIRGSISILFASLFIIRIITEFTFWGFQLVQSLIILPFCIFPVVCYLSVLFIPKFKV